MKVDSKRARDFWSEDRVQSFSRAFKGAMAAARVRVEDFDNLKDRAISTKSKKKDHWGSKSSAERLLAGGKLQSTTLTGILITIGTKINQTTSFDRGYDDDLKLVRDLYETWIIENSAKKTGDQSEEPDLRDATAIRNSIDTLGAYLSLKDDLPELGEKIFFRRDDPDQIHFLTFRFASSPGFIQRSFTVIHRPSKSLPVTRFANYYDHDGRVRHSHGPVLPFGKQVLLLGQSDNGEAPKVLSVVESKPQNIYSGLLLSYEPDRDMVASRFLMIRTTDISHHEKADTGVRPISQSGLTDSQIDRIRNRIPFVLEKGVEDDRGHEIEQADMVALVLSLLFEKGEDGNHLLNMKSTAKRKPVFNPADHKHYTFNAALKQAD